MERIFVAEGFFGNAEKNKNNLPKSDSFWGDGI